MIAEGLSWLDNDYDIYCCKSNYCNRPQSKKISTVVIIVIIIIIIFITTLLIFVYCAFKKNKKITIIDTGNLQRQQTIQPPIM